VVIKKSRGLVSHTLFNFSNFLNKWLFMKKKLKEFCQTTLEVTISKFPKEDIERLKKNISNLLEGTDNENISQSAMQKPTFHYYTGLTDRPWWEIEFMPKEQLVALKEKIKLELQSILSTKQLSRFSISVTEEYPPSYLDGQMNTYHIIRDLDPDQTIYIKRQSELPNTMVFLRSIPRLAEDAFFSCLTPGTHLKAHEAEDNVRLNVHLGLEIPRGSGISVANQQRIWPEEQLLCFDPSFTHDAWNFGITNRYILLFTIWHPDLTDAEIFFIKLFAKDYSHYV
jgi:Aspartyl/Asparaginyl beta-hydroxylase